MYMNEKKDWLGTILMWMFLVFMSAIVILWIVGFVTGRGSSRSDEDYYSCEGYYCY